MKKLLLFLIVIAFSQSLWAQKLDKDRYTISGGILAAYNSDKFQIQGDNTYNIEYNYASGYSAGVWLNLPLGTAFSVEPQVLLSLYNYNPKPAAGAPFLAVDGSVTYVQIPVMLKWHWGKSFALTAGPQFDLVQNTDLIPVSTDKDSLTS